MTQDKGRRWPFMVATDATEPPQAGALSEDAGRTWLITDGAGRWLRCTFAGVPDWTPIRANARRYDAEAAARKLCALRGVTA